ncbi:hypothetical protein V6N12_045879 [Hibiscus sabdariffa]|uniref:Reverse transcriptase zinc-binding domain-containing protein n=1 Tax=Hibiscus sabdariffa TaxID=183260 RepID=A0ABR2G3Z4_9ROSI
MECFRRNLTLNCGCTVCGDAQKNMDHIFRRCPVALSIWFPLIREDKVEEFFSLDFKQWLFVNLSNVEGFGRDRVHWDVLFGFLLWNLWRKRNEWVFSDQDWSGEPVLQRVLRMQHEAIAARPTLASDRSLRSTNVGVPAVG